MFSRISLSDDSSYIILEVTGEITRETIMPENIKAHKLGKEMGIRKFLVDATGARNTETVLNNYKIAYEDIRHAPEMDVTAIVAMLVSPDDHSHDFFETTAKNSGLNVNLFRDKQKAIEFLNSQ